VLLSWLAFLTTLALIVVSVAVKKEESLFLMEAVTVEDLFLRWVGLGCMAMLSLALAVHYTRVMLEKEHIRVDTYECTESELVNSILLLPWSTGLHADICRSLLENLVNRMIHNPNGFGIIDKVKILVSKAGDAFTSPQVDVILSGISVELLTREQITEFLRRRTAFRRAEKWPEFQTQLLQTLLRHDLEEWNKEWQLTAEDLELLETILNGGSLSEAEQNFIKLRLEIGVRPESAKGPFTAAPPPVPTSVCVC
ncbi:MAG: hypothetical protein AAB767_03900, partial [Patescibacteria group bacterium]